jgi:hypothetical protein
MMMLLLLLLLMPLPLMTTMMMMLLLLLKVIMAVIYPPRTYGPVIITFSGGNTLLNFQMQECVILQAKQVRTRKACTCSNQLLLLGFVYIAPLLWRCHSSRTFSIGAHCCRG